MQRTISEERTHHIRRDGTLKLASQHLFRKITNAMNVLKADILLPTEQETSKLKVPVKMRREHRKFFTMCCSYHEAEGPSLDTISSYVSFYILEVTDRNWSLRPSLEILEHAVL
jgi:hypothetical protein